MKLSGRRWRFYRAGYSSFKRWGGQGLGLKKPSGIRTLPLEKLPSVARLWEVLEMWLRFEMELWRWWRQVGSCDDEDGWSFLTFLALSHVQSNGLSAYHYQNAYGRSREQILQWLQNVETRYSSQHLAAVTRQDSCLVDVCPARRASRRGSPKLALVGLVRHEKIIKKPSNTHTPRDTCRVSVLWEKKTKYSSLLRNFWDGWVWSDVPKRCWNEPKSITQSRCFRNTASGGRWKRQHDVCHRGQSCPGDPSAGFSEFSVGVGFFPSHLRTCFGFLGGNPYEASLSTGPGRKDYSPSYERMEATWKNSWGQEIQSLPWCNPSLQQSQRKRRTHFSCDTWLCL